MIYSAIVAVLLVLHVTLCPAETIFPPGIDQRWYAKHYVALQEAPIWPLAELDKSMVVYRYLTLPTWGNPSLIRIDVNSDGNKILTIKETSGDGGYDPGILAINRTIPISEMDFSSFTNLLNRTDFWNLPNSLPDQPGVDGFQAIIEAIEHGRYHIVDWWCPDDVNFTLAFSHLHRLCFPEELIPPLALLETLFDTQPQSTLLSLNPEGWFHIVKEGVSEEHLRERYG